MSERIARFLGTGRFLAIQTVIVAVWIALNLTAWFGRWDPYPFILLNLAFSTQAAYAAPLILLAQNRQDDRDRVSLDEDRARAERTKADTEYLARELAALRIAVGEVATRDYLRGELDKLCDRLGAAPAPAAGAGQEQQCAAPEPYPARSRLIRSSTRRSASSSRSTKWCATPRRWVARRGAQPGEPRVGEPGGHSAPVVLHRAAGHEPTLLQPIDQPRDTRPGQQHGIGELGHPQPPVGRLGQLHQHVVGGEGELLLGEQLDLQHPHDGRVGTQEGPPGRQLLAGGAGPRPDCASGCALWWPQCPSRALMLRSPADKSTDVQWEPGVGQPRPAASRRRWKVQRNL